MRLVFDATNSLVASPPTDLGGAPAAPAAPTSDYLARVAAAGIALPGAAHRHSDGVPAPARPDVAAHVAEVSRKAFAGKHMTFDGDGEPTAPAAPAAQATDPAAFIAEMSKQLFGSRKCGS